MTLSTKIRSLFNPSMYQGWGNSRKYFEGWYFKVVNAPETKAFAFIPGISMNESGEKIAFIQVLDGREKKSEFHEYEFPSFRPSGEKFALSIGNNLFSASGMKLELPEVKGELSFTGNRGCPNPWYAPGIMGPYTFAPFMEYSHEVVSMDHSLSGTLTINGRETDFTGGRLTSLDATVTEIELEFRNRSHVLRVSAPADTATPLAAPVKGMMGGRIEESMTSAITLTLTERGTGRIVYTGEGRNACIEKSGDMQTLSQR